MLNNDISKVINAERLDIPSAVYSLLQYSQPTTASLERSFSMPRKLLTEDINFKVENAKEYMIYISILAPG